MGKRIQVNQVLSVFGVELDAIQDPWERHSMVSSSRKAQWPPILEEDSTLSRENNLFVKMEVPKDFNFYKWHMYVCVLKKIWNISLSLLKPFMSPYKQYDYNIKQVAFELCI